MLEVSGICKSYGKHRILNGVSFSAGPGQCVGIVGTNGCGKTTLLSILAGALRADSGSIRINGTEILGRSGAAADLTAYVPQENPLIGELSVKDNLLLWHRGSRKEMEKDLTEGCSSVLGIGPMLKKRVDTLSGGMKSASASPAPFQAAPLSSLWTNQEPPWTWNVNGIYRPI